MKKYIIILLSTVPMLSLAQSRLSFSTLVDKLVTLINTLTVIVMGCMVVVFLYGMVRYIYKNNDNAQEHQKGITFMLWSIIIFFVMVSVWGLINLLGGIIFS